MTKEDPGAFRVKVKVKAKNPAPKKGKGRAKGQRSKAAAPKAPPHRSLMEALKQVAPPEPTGQAPRAPDRPLERATGEKQASKAATHPTTSAEPASETATGPQPGSAEAQAVEVRKPFGAPAFPLTEVEEAEVEIVHLDAGHGRVG